jgi:nucleotide-binding universal stress UspA family protein
MPNIDTPKSIMLCLAFPENPYQEDYDLEEYGRYAYEKARRMAKKLGASIHILAIIEEYHYAYDEIEAEFEKKRLERTQEAVQRLQNDLAADGIEVESTIDDGIAWYEIIKHSVWKDVDWLMLSATRKGVSSDGSVLGSTARKVVRKSEKPVWVVHDTPAKPIKSIAMAIDFHEISRKIAKIGLQLAEILEARPKFVHSVDYSGELAFFRYADSEKRREKYRHDVREKAREELRKLAGDKADATDILISEHNVTHVLPAMVENGDADMVVMGSVSRTGIAGFIVGNSAEKLLDRLECSLLVLKPDEWTSPLEFEKQG